MSDDDEAQQARFEQTVEELRAWLEKRCTPPQAISVMGSLASEMIWQQAKNSKATETEVMDFCARMAKHVRTLNIFTVEVTLQ
jgi:hypothetical protein